MGSTSVAVCDVYVLATTHMWCTLRACPCDPSALGPAAAPCPSAVLLLVVRSGLPRAAGGGRRTRARLTVPPFRSLRSWLVFRGHLTFGFFVSTLTQAPTRDCRAVRGISNRISCVRLRNRRADEVYGEDERPRPPTGHSAVRTDDPRAARLVTGVRTVAFGAAPHATRRRLTRVHELTSEGLDLGRDGYDAAAAFLALSAATISL